MTDHTLGPLLPTRPRPVLRFPGYDYTNAGGYFVTICTRARTCHFGNVVGGAVTLSSAGRIVQETWDSLPQRFSVAPDEFVVMPNHVHGIVQLYGDSGLTLGEIVRVFKAISTRTIRQAGMLDFAWQSNYHEHIIRNEHELERVRNYIVSNPLMWEDDPENPERPRSTGTSGGDAGAGWAR